MKIKRENSNLSSNPTRHELQKIVSGFNRVTVHASRLEPMTCWMRRSFSMVLSLPLTRTEHYNALRDGKDGCDCIIKRPTMVMTCLMYIHKEWDRYEYIYLIEVCKRKLMVTSVKIVWIGVSKCDWRLKRLVSPALISVSSPNSPPLHSYKEWSNESTTHQLSSCFARAA